MDEFFALLIVLIPVIIVVGLIVLAANSSPKTAKHCNVCSTNVTPKKNFNWIVFIFLCGFCYLPIYIAQSPHCPVCNSNSFSSVDPIK